MPMNYTETSTLENNSWFRDRVRVSVSSYTNYLLNTDPADELYDQKIQLATQLGQQNMMVIQTLMFILPGDAEVQAAGPAIPDAQLQAIVEKTLGKFWPVPPASNPAMFRQGTMYAPPLPPPPPRNQ